MSAAVGRLAAAGGTAPPRAALRARALTAESVAAGAVFALAGTLRLIALGRTPLDPFYAGAVRSMSASWHNLLVGAYDPSAQMAIDKSPLDLWLQVASTRLLGFTPFALLLPAALAGTLAVVALYDLLRTLVDSRAALAGALALAVLPIAVITSRSHTMDSVMAAALVAAFAVAARGLRSGRTSRIAIAGALVGVAFETKLFEALLAAPPLALMWWLGARTSRRRRLAGIGAAAAACVAVGLAWLVAVSVLVPSADRPWAMGSTNGSAWSSTFVYDGWSRLVGSGVTMHHATPAARRAALRQVPAPAGPLRLISSQVHLGRRLGIELVAAWAALLAALALRGLRGVDRAGRAGLAALAAWLALGTVLFSAQAALRPRYLEAFDPAVAACLGAAGVLAFRAARGRVPRALAALTAAGVLGASLAASATAVANHVQDSGTPGALAPRRLSALSAYLRAHQGGARYEVASALVGEAGALIAHDARPVLMLSAAHHELVGVGRFARLVAAGEVHAAIPARCLPGRSCPSVSRWIRAHGTDVSIAAGQPHAGLVYALHPVNGPGRR